MLATIMAGNVAITIMPSQRELVDAVSAGRGADPAVARRAPRRVSIHNNYLTFPVIVLMVSNHFPGCTVTRELAVAARADRHRRGVRHILNIRFTFAQWVPALGLTLAAGFALLFVVGRQRAGPSDAAVSARRTSRRR